MIKFGSRVDVFDAAGGEPLKVKMGSRVIGGSTVLAVLPQMLGKENPVRQQRWPNGWPPLSA